MALFVLSDTHLSLKNPKPMDIFGERWRDHTEKIKYFFEREISENDTVVIPGDISWALSLEDALPDLKFLSSLPGRKIIGKGNHDFWWSTVSKIEKLFAENKIDNLSLLFNNAFSVDGCAVCGTRGWYSDQTSPAGVDRPKIVAREAGRLRRSLEAGKALGADELLAFMHFPPVFGDFVCRELLDVLKEYGVRRCFYGHMHGQYSIPKSFTYEDVTFIITAGDYLQFRPMRIESAKIE